MSNTEINKELVEWAYANLKNLPKGVEYEKMISSVPYDCFDKTLFLTRNLAHEAAIDYSDIRLKNYDFDLKKHQEARVEYLSKIFGKVTPDTFIEPPFFVDYGCNVKFGKGFYCNFNATFLDCTLITFGEGVLVGPNCTFTTATHPTDPTDRARGLEFAHPIHVGDHCWFGSDVVVLPGVTIGNSCVIGAGAVVTKDVPDNSVVVGSPGRVIKTVKPLNREGLVKLQTDLA